MANSTERAEYELKFVMLNAHVHTFLPWLRAHCRPHGEFPSAIISSIYYDHLDWRLLGSKIDSFYLKSKVRLRWYSPLGGASAPENSYLEAKFKIGPQRRKVRILTEHKKSELETVPLAARELSELPRLLHPHGFLDTSGLTPAFQISYTRQRFVHAASQCVFCLDYDIHVPRVNHSRLSFANPSFIPAAVFEQKGPLDQLSPLLDFLPHFGLKKGAFSKYSRCFKHISE